MSKKSKTTTGPSKFAQPFIQRGAAELDSAYGQAKGAVQAQTDNVMGLLNPFLTDRMQNGDPGVNAARDYGVDVLSGKYLEGNPYLDQIIADSNNDIKNQMQASLGVKGLTGGSDYANLISRNIARNSTNLRYGDYNAERGRMDGAAGRAGGIASADYLPVQGLLSSLQASKAPFDLASQYAGGLGGLLGGYQTQSQPSGILNNLIGAGAQLGSAAFMASERRVKRDVEQVGELPDGLNIYRFNYVWDDEATPQTVGVMVDEVQALRPWALGPVVDGIQTVDYSKLEMAA